MNPSAQGWIKKLLKELDSKSSVFEEDEATFYTALRNCGFIYGFNQNIVNNIFDSKNLTEDEICKINLCLALLFFHYKSNCEIPFIESVYGFYKDINELKTSFFKEIIKDRNQNSQVEKIIHKRIQIDDNIFTKNFKYFVINALLYIDVLAYKEYLKNQSISIAYIKDLEASFEAISLHVLNSKKIKNAYDLSLIELFEVSLRYKDTNKVNYIDAIKFINTDLKKYYVIDLACMASWTDKIIDHSEHTYLLKLGDNLNLNKEIIEASITSVNTFYTQHKNSIALLSSKSLVKSFYNNSSKMVSKLITRNSKRLYQELKDSKELMILLSQSTVRELTKEEQKKVNEQLLDIFKSIPSLAIFMLPGGALLLPLVIKFIPKLLPSAFDENRIKED